MKLTNRNISPKKLENGISIIIPVYNAEKYLMKTMETYLNQTYDNYEVILVNDGSSDGTAQICESLKNEFSNVRVITKENEGVSKARNDGIKEAKKEYIMFLDADDFLEEYALEFMANAVDLHETDGVIAGYKMELHNKNDVVTIVHCPGEDRILEGVKDFFDVDIWEKSLMYNVWNRLYKHEIIIENGVEFPSFNMGEDLYFNMTYMLHCQKISLINDALYRYVRERDGSATSRYVPGWFEIRSDEQQRLVEYYNCHIQILPDFHSFLNLRYIERVWGCIVNEFHVDNKGLTCDKWQSINEMVNSDIVLDASSDAHPRSVTMKIMIIVLRTRSTIMVFVFGKMIAIFKKLFAAFFYNIRQHR